MFAIPAQHQTSGPSPWALPVDTDADSPALGESASAEHMDAGQGGWSSGGAASLGGQDMEAAAVLGHWTQPSASPEPAESGAEPAAERDPSGPSAEGPSAAGPSAEGPISEAGGLHTSSIQMVQFAAEVGAGPAGWDFDAPWQSFAPDTAGGDKRRLAVAAHGIQGSGAELPYRAQLEAAFGAGHDLSHVQAHIGGAADEAGASLQAAAFATGHHLAFRNTPSLHLAAHEAAHVIQQAAGARPTAGAGSQDALETEADAVADRVVRGESAADLLRPYLQGTTAARGAAVRGDSVQCKDDGNAASAGELGLVAWDGSPALRLRMAPSASSQVLGSLAFSTRLQINQRLPGHWLQVSLLDGRSGFVDGTYVWSAPEHPLPEPNAVLHRVQPGLAGAATSIVKQYYNAEGEGFKWHDNQRFFVAVLAHVNHLAIPSGIDGWRKTQFQAGQIIWVPSRAFATTMRGQVSSGSLSFEVADSVGLAAPLERAGQLLDDCTKAIKLSGPFLGQAIKLHVMQSAVSVLESLALMAVGSIAVLAASTAIGTLVGGPAGAAAGFEVGLAILEWAGLGFLIQWLASSLWRAGVAIATFFATIWKARGDEKILLQGAMQFADAIGILLGIAVEVVVMWAAAKGVKKAVSALKNTALGRAFGESRLGTWLNERIANYKTGQSKLPGPSETLAQLRARRHAESLGLSQADAAVLLRKTSPSTLSLLHERLGPEGMKQLASKPPAYLDIVFDALRVARKDSVATSEIARSLELNQSGSLSNLHLESSLAAYLNFRSRFGNRIAGDFISRFRRLVAEDVRQAEAELRLAEDLLAGKTALGKTGKVEALAESAIPSEQTPEFRVNSPQGAKLVECKTIGRTGEPFTKNTVRNNVGTANSQLRDQSMRTGETHGLIRLDGREAGATDASPQTLADWVNSKLPSPRDSVVTRWVEIFYKNGSGEQMKVVLELDPGSGAFQVRSAEAIR